MARPSPAEPSAPASASSVSPTAAAATATPESQAFIESWFGKLKERLVWRSEFETLDQARKELAAYIDRYHHRPHSGLRYRTPAEVRQTWEDEQRLAKTAA